MIEFFFDSLTASIVASSRYSDNTHIYLPFLGYLKHLTHDVLSTNLGHISLFPLVVTAQSTQELKSQYVAVAFHDPGRGSQSLLRYISTRLASWYAIKFKKFIIVMSSIPHQKPVAPFGVVESPQDQNDDTASIRTASTVDQTPNLNHLQSHPSHSQDAPIQPYTSYIEVPDEIYDRLGASKKIVIVALLSFCSFLAPVSSTTILSAIPEVAATYQSTGTILNLSNALYLVFMGISPCVWGPLSQVYGRRSICLITAILFLGCSLGTALSPNLVSYFIFRILTAFEGTSFLTIGASCIGDIYRPTERATAMGWFLSGTLIGPALGPFIGGIIVTFKSWRVIFYLQTALAGVATIGAYFLLPETIHHKKSDDLIGLPFNAKAKVLWGMLNPWRVIKLYKYPNLIMVALASSSLVWNMYSLLTPIRYILNPRFNLISPIQSGLFYLAPGCGYILGTFLGGRYADHITITWAQKRNGIRVPEDRLRSALPFMGILIPSCMLIYGWV
ncbi:hypothetical protein G7Y89_g8974 [Cudoniella acicularis]|uniref:Major facilitator superfamily (MFS) profile domain-containing protein n=1 Tax=Cudoniella acicularis TaxID=354080 RepID=A0A8H4RIC7_9HELO|nr:hypothetical protein G7Y89_g8974 [Cudoniella acicularis]